MIQISSGYTPMKIEHIDEVLPHIEGRQDFVIADKGSYKVIDYVYALPDTFDHPARLECRGLKFAPDGTVLARPFQKFFNIGERPNTQPNVLNFDQQLSVMEKLDGSMVHAAIVDGELVFMTRMGRTDVARKAERHITDEVEATCRDLLNMGHTPIFEFTAPDNRIIITYPESSITLLAIRSNTFGTYLDHGDVCEFAEDAGVRAVVIHDTPRTAPEFVAFARAVTGMEGFVIRFHDGLMVKAKGEDYVLKHRAKDSVLQEKNVLALILRDELDDVLPLLDAVDRANVERYAADVRAGIERTTEAVDVIVSTGRGLEQKAFAVDHLAVVPAYLRPIAFQVRAGSLTRQTIADSLLKQCGSQSAVDKARPLFGARFDMVAANDNGRLAGAA